MPIKCSGLHHHKAMQSRFLVLHQRPLHLRHATSTVVITFQTMTFPLGVWRVESNCSAEIARLILYFLLLNRIMHTHTHTHAHTLTPSCTHPHTYTYLQCNSEVSLDAYMSHFRNLSQPTYVTLRCCGCSTATIPVADISHYWNIPMVGG